MIRKVCLILAVVGLSNILCADVQITDVKATPISPWSVIIDYNVNGEGATRFLCNTNEVGVRFMPHNQPVGGL
jgi:hypothetical protein